MFDNTLPVSMSDNSQLSLDNSEMTTSVKVISYNFPDMIDESSGTFTDYTASNLDNGYHTTSSVVSCRSFITSSNYYNINNNLKVSEHAYLFSSGSNNYWSWRKPSDIQVGDYLLGINEEIRQVSSSEHIVSGTLGLSQINVEDVDTLFVNGYLVHNDLQEDPPPGGGSGATFSFVNQSASIHLNAKHSRSPFLNQLDENSTSTYLLSDINAGNDCSSAFRLRGGLSTGGGLGTAQNIKLGMRTSPTSDDFRFIEVGLGSGNNGLGAPLSGSGITNRTIDIQLSGSFVDDDPSPAVSVPTTTIHLITPGEYKGHMQMSSSTNSGASTFGNFIVINLLTAKRFDVTGTPNPFNFRDVDSSAFTNAFPTHSGEPRKAQISAKDIRDFATNNVNKAKPNFRATDSQTQESALAGSGFSPAGNREQETISMDEMHSSSFTTFF